MLRRMTLAFLVAGIATLGSAQAAAALTCVPPPPASEQFQRAHAAVLGQVIEMELLGPEPAFNSYLNCSAVRYRIQVLEVHKGRQWLSASEEIDAFGAYYGHLGYPPQPPTQPFAFLLNRGPAGWGPPFGPLCGRHQRRGPSTARRRESGTRPAGPVHPRTPEAARLQVRAVGSLPSRRHHRAPPPPRAQARHQVQRRLLSQVPVHGPCLDGR